jgi:hypothetical protein
MVWKSRKDPIPKKPDPMIGTIQWIAAVRPVHPNQKRQIGMQNAATVVGPRRFSGLMTSLPISLRFLSNLR